MPQFAHLCSSGYLFFFRRLHLTDRLLQPPPPPKKKLPTTPLHLLYLLSSHFEFFGRTREPLISYDSAQSTIIPRYTGWRFSILDRKSITLLCRRHNTRPIFFRAKTFKKFDLGVPLQQRSNILYTGIEITPGLLSAVNSLVLAPPALSLYWHFSSAIFNTVFTPSNCARSAETTSSFERILRPPEAKHNLTAE